MKNRTVKIATATGCLILILAAAGCATFFSLVQEPLEGRVKQYMQAQVDKKWDLAYSFLDASTREKISREDYISKNRNLSYTGFTIEEINLLSSEDQAAVKVRINLLFMGYEFPRAPQTQEWIKEKGGWFVKPKPAPETPFGPRKKNKE